MNIYKTYSRQEWQMKRNGGRIPHSGLMIKDGKDIKHFLIPRPGLNPDETKKTGAVNSGSEKKTV